MSTAVDTNVLLDLLIPGAEHGTRASRWLEDAGSVGPLVICEAVYAELAGGFRDSATLDAYLAEIGITVPPSSRETLYRAGVVWRRYAARRPDGLQCAGCGEVTRVRCEACDERLTARQHIVADFLVGAHAVEHADRLLTRDRGFYREYFPELALA